MDLGLKKQWEHQQQPQQQDVGSEDQQEPKVLQPLTHPQLNVNAIIPHNNNDNKEDHPLPSCSSAGSTLPLFVPDHSTPPHQQPPSKTQTYPWTWSYFSVAQWQELELQALIYRYLLSGTAVPPELLHPIKKSLAHQSPSLFHRDHHQQLQPHLECFLHHPQSQPFRFQAGYWGSASMDPEPGRCRRTDGKKWRCSRDVVLGQKYCERHVHRGRNRSRKPVEIPPTLRTHATASATGGSIGVVSGSYLKTNPVSVPVMATGASHFTLSGPSAHSPVNLIQMNRSHSGPTPEFMTRNVSSGGQVLRHFFEDWPRPLQDPDPDAVSLTGLSMSMAGNSSSDVSLKLSTGDVERIAAVDDLKREQTQGSNRSVGWWSNREASMGGPLAEALRSSAATNHSSPPSVLHRLTCGLGTGTSLITQV